MAVKLGTAYVDIQGNFDAFEGGLDGLLKGSKWKTVAAGVAGIGAAALGAGVALYKIGEQFDDAYDTIRVGTGKTGKDLEGLKNDFKNVVKTVPTDFKTAAVAVSTLNQRLGITGRPLQHLSSQFLELSRLTGTDLKTNIESATRAFGDWGIKTKNQPAALDQLFRAFQKTGVPVAKLSDLITRYGAPLRQLGFGFSEATALVGQFEKAGVNTQLVMGSMRIALGKMAKSGEEPIDTFKRVTDAIKNTGSTSEANKMALELFGARAGPDMAAAIREGKFSIDDLAKSIAGGGDTILKAGKDTQDFSEKWQLFKNKVMVWLEPLAAKVFGGMADAMDAIGPAAEKVRDVFQAVVDRLKGGEGPAGKFGEAFNSVKSAISGVIDVAVAFWNRFGGPITDLLTEVGKALASFAENVTQVLGGVINLVAGIFTGDWKRAWDGIKNIFSGVWGAFRDIVNLAWETVKAAIRAGLSALGAVFEEFGKQLLGLGGWVVDQIVAGLKKAWEGLKDLGGWIKDKFVGFIKAEIEGFKTIGGWVVDRVVDGVKAVASAVKTAGVWIKDQLVGFIKAEIEGFKTIGSWVINRIADGIKTVTDALGSVGGWIKNRVVEFVQGAAEGFKSVGSWVINRIVDGIKTVTDALGSVGGWIKNRVVDGIETLKDGFVGAGSWVINRIAEGIKTITDALSGVGGWLKNRVMDGIENVKDGFLNIGGKVIDWIVDGLKGGAKALAGFINKLIGLINKIPGVDIPKVAFAAGGTTDDIPAFATGGVTHHNKLAKGGLITRPMMVVGEEAPCIAKGTLVETGHGQAPIETIPAGTMVMTRAGLRRVLWSGLTRADADVLVVKTTSGLSVKCTYDHLIWMEPRSEPQEAGWLHAEHLKPGDTVWTWDGAALNRSEVESVQGCAERIDTYDLLVEDEHEFIAGGILVHNSHPEFIIPTNPAYRTRARMLTGQLLGALGGDEKRLAHYAKGGVNAGSGASGGGDWSSPSALSLLTRGASWLLDKLPNPSDLLPDWLKGTGRWLIDQVSGWIKNKVKGLFGAGGSLGGGNASWDLVAGLASKFGLTMTSGFRPGDDGWHGRGRARDYSNGGGPTPQMLAFAKTVAAAIGSRLLELIYTPLGWGIKNGGRIGSFGPAVDADHYDHVHVALAKGGVFGGPFVGSYKNGGIVPADGIAHVHQGETIMPNGFQPEIRVFLGTREIEDLVRVEVDEQSRQAGAQFLAGARR